MTDMLRAFEGKKVFLTGHTGFKGAWLLQLLQMAGAQVKGYALPPQNDKDLYCQIDGDQLCYASVMGDIRDEHLLQGELVRFQPDYVFHLAAQSLVRYGYEQPIDTFSVNVMGTIHMLNALRNLDHPCVGVMVTTDKVYENDETGRAFGETDSLGGYDPYSASKAASEIAIASYRRSYFPPEAYAQHGKKLVSLRAGNVIGGGDYSEHRIIPDIVRAIERSEVVKLRNPTAIRPWQHVIEPLYVYLALAAKMTSDATTYAPSYNIGPDLTDVKDVETLTKTFIGYYGDGAYQIEGNAGEPHEAQTLLLRNDLIKRDLNWQPLYDADEAIRHTAYWYADKERAAQEKCNTQITDYLTRIHNRS